MREITFYNGVRVPALGLGARGIWGGIPARDSGLAESEYVKYCYAINSGLCRLFDTSESYGWNEEVLGNAIRDTGVRKELTLITKVGNHSQTEGNIKRAFERSLSRLKTDYIDVYLMHWPQYGTFINTWLEMEKLYEEGLVRAIGVCNCQIHHLEELLQRTNITPMVHEFEIHPLFTQETLINYCIAKDIRVMAYSPLGRMHDVLIKSKPVQTLAKKYAKTPVQILVRWHYQSERIAIPQTANPQHFDEIFQIEDFELTTREIAWISSLNENIRLRYNPDTCDFSRLG